MNLKSTFKYLLVFMFGLNSLLIIAQNNSDGNASFFGFKPIDYSQINRTFTISYFDNFVLNLDESTNWTLTNFETKETLETGSSKFNKQFGKPGRYFISTHVKQQDVDECSKHEHVNYLIIVTENHMTFDFSSVTISPNLKGDEYRTYSLSVKVNFKNFDNKNQKFFGEITGSGVGVEMSGRTNQEQVELMQGETILEYTLAGICKKGGYLTLDFKDINGNLRSYYLTNKVD